LFVKIGIIAMETIILIGLVLSGLFLFNSNIFSKYTKG
jgi:hypothetical protein